MQHLAVTVATLVAITAIAAVIVAATIAAVKNVAGGNSGKTKIVAISVTNAAIAVINTAIEAVMPFKLIKGV